MASIITGILSSTVGLLLNKVRNKTADKLKDGDVTDAKIREIIVRELNDVKTKIDGLSRSYLHSSYSFLQEGVDVLKASLDKAEEKQKAVHNEIHVDGGETSTKPSNTESGFLNEAFALSKDMQQMIIHADKELETAKERFKDARKEATRAFCNEALSIKDRIFAAKIRIVSELLECLESPETAIAGCLSFLKKLHSLPAIREIFSVYISRGYKSLINKAERVEHVKSVMLINYVLFQFVFEFSSKYFSPMTWPTIELGDRSFRPILDWLEVSTRRSWGEKFIHPSNEVILDEEIDRYACSLNSHGEIIARAKGGNINVTSRTGEVKMVKLTYSEDSVEYRYIIGLAVASNNNVYILNYLKTRNESGLMLKNYVVNVFDENYNVKQNCMLHFLDAVHTPFVEIAINKLNNIIIDTLDESFNHHVYVCSNDGELKHKFKEAASVHTLAISHKNEIFLASSDLAAFHRYTEKGGLESTIKVPKRHQIRRVAFHHIICKILVLTRMEMIDSFSYFLLSYSEEGEMEDSILLCKGSKFENPQIRSHPSGPVVLVWKKSITFI